MVVFNDSRGSDVVRSAGNQNLFKADFFGFFQCKGQQGGPIAFSPLTGPKQISDISAVLKQRTTELVTQIKTTDQLPIVKDTEGRLRNQFWPQEFLMLAALQFDQKGVKVFNMAEIVQSFEIAVKRMNLPRHI